MSNRRFSTAGFPMTIGAIRNADSLRCLSLQKSALLAGKFKALMELHKTSYMLLTVPECSYSIGSYLGTIWDYTKNSHIHRIGTDCTTNERSLSESYQHLRDRAGLRKLQALHSTLRNEDRVLRIRLSHRLNVFCVQWPLHRTTGKGQKTRRHLSPFHGNEVRPVIRKRGSYGKSN